jgi:16S rRNA (cytidine1402-2'-O)-methyltransferase
MLTVFEGLGNNVREFWWHSQVVRQKPAKLPSPVQIRVPPYSLFFLGTPLLYIVATPIGNLEDISFRGISTLKLVDYILCEDTRRTAKLLFHYQIPTKIYSFHGFNEKNKEEMIIGHLREGKKVALVSDAGMPTISDPGSMLVQRCNKEGIAVTCIPGPSAIITALALSGMPTTSFQFLGFFPKKNGEILKVLDTVLAFSGTSIFFESPHRLLKTLKKLPDEIHVAIAKELTKIHEAVVQDKPSVLYELLKKQSIKGEYVLLMQASLS